MHQDRLFVLQVVIAIEQQWFAAGRHDAPFRAERRYRICDYLFAAADEESAYSVACGWVAADAFSDSNHDGPGDLTRIFSIGIHQLEEIVRASELSDKANEFYGVELPGFYLGNVSADGVPLIREKADLEVFRLQQFSCRRPAAE